MDFADWSWLILPCLAGALPGTLIGGSIECHQIGRLLWLIAWDELAEAVGGLFLGVLLGGVVGLLGGGDASLVRSLLKCAPVGGATGLIMGYRGGDRGWLGLLEGLVVGLVLGGAAAAVFQWVI
jgi:hypothetical protein